MAFLFGFAKHRHVHQTLTDVVVTFDTDKNLLITESEIFTALNLPMDSITATRISQLSIKELEAQLESNEMIKEAQVYTTINGVLGVEVTQRKPILRFYDGGFHYLDEEGNMMPMSTNYSARVPIAMGIPSAEIQQYYKLASLLYEDHFLKKNIVAFQRNNKDEIFLELRDQDVRVSFGRLENEKLKLANLKAFYMKASKEDLFKNYVKIDLQYGSQVVCTKK
jgi:cell division protein FtsQ